MPFDTHCIDEKILLPNTIETNLAMAIDLLKAMKKRVVLSAYPQVGKKTQFDLRVDLNSKSYYKFSDP